MDGEKSKTVALIAEIASGSVAVVSLVVLSQMYLLE